MKIDGYVTFEEVRTAILKKQKQGMSDSDIIVSVAKELEISNKNVSDILEVLNNNLKEESSMEKKKDDNEFPKTELLEDGKVINFSIKVSDLALLIKNSPEYCEQYVKRGKEAEFIYYILNRLSEPSGHDDAEKWSISFEEIFLSILEGAFKKQIPILPSEYDCCTICGTYLKDENDIKVGYCSNCGQSISW